MDQYFTSNTAAQLLVQCALQFSTKPIRSICEPCAGDGSLVHAAKDALPDASIYAFELDETLCEKHGWTQGDFLTAEPVACDVVLCNPPFNVRSQETTTTSKNGKRGKDRALAFLIKACSFAPLLAFIMHQNKGNPNFATQLYKARPDVALVHRQIIEKPASVFRLREAEVSGNSPCGAISESAATSTVGDFRKNPSGDISRNHNPKPKHVPCAIYIYRTMQENVQAPVIYKSLACVDLELLHLNDPRCNLIVKSWGSFARVGTVVTIDKSLILEEVARHTKPGVSGNNPEGVFPESPASEKQAACDFRKNPSGVISEKPRKPGTQGANMHFMSMNPERSELIIQAAYNDMHEFLSYARECPNVKITPAQFIHFYNKHIESV